MKLLFIFLWTSFSILAMEEVLKSENLDENSPVSIDLEAAFNYAVQDFNKDKDKHNIIFSPSAVALKNYQRLKDTQYQSVEKKICRKNLSCECINVCYWTHCKLAAYHSTDLNSVQSIWKKGFPILYDGSMGDGVYFATWKNGNEDINSYVVVCVVMCHDGRVDFSRINESKKWRANIDIKYKFYSDKNVVKDPEKIIPLGVVYKKELKNPFTKD